jgi:hypothetical protein
LHAWITVANPPVKAFTFFSAAKLTRKKMLRGAKRQMVLWNAAIRRIWIYDGVSEVRAARRRAPPDIDVADMPFRRRE